MDIAIVDFFSDRKAKSLKKNSSAGMSELEILDVHAKTESEFHLHNWLPDAARRAGQISLSSHPCTFSHPSGRKNKNGKTSTIIADAIARPDGLVRSGNVHAELDALGNAAALDVYKFLTLTLSDGRQLISHIEQNTDQAKSLLAVPTANYEALRTGFLAMKERETVSVTSSKIKQVYFPVVSNYHQLSILTPSGLMYELRKRIDEIRFGDTTKLAKDLRKKNELSVTGFNDIHNLGMIGYGGTKPQNISVLNNQYAGKAYLLPSLPPVLQAESVRLPTNDFFTNCLWPNQFKVNLELLHKWLIDSRNNIQVRTRRDELFLDLFNDIVEKIWQIRGTEAGWSLKERFDSLPKLQKIMLDQYWIIERTENEQYVDNFLKDIARWMILAYKKVLGKQALALNDDELSHVLQLICEQKEALL
ncbi:MULTISPECIES: type I-F CRISPR-associated protein Csy1 [unclassified Undibacterium]|uniref:type I-F CRISPR-associated protein Csy1 n=1 Tax=unclassified Undibacterium TaxID=2630295 RepID=UPI002AC94B08|nr:MULTISPECIES: type I-F CRISPR-associated protein Csy1 [unclassified Undibacterium]MEB0139126.1 type I-F CRISPR-associated protein Csy1 [Undibacterium sp. CCC2.1]MEB0172894.1 type I-F CRISPR-associated protein Csy1 [Undibacterium sp. CCC1.1]MEB0176634.1 type I-F CRISPR-associated protein Csy1 [Undibacterium sp. CCC3.4]MEB0216038.1 type I-F CRISPR-associated protein Csy1 [Undibacterium sp. 5I2]WPX43121.1 type I-F CRISPR-associated protein Csy1 [Undibacterium sp. CCC3.4]